MTKNQKIALGCGGAGCLGLIVVAIAGALIYFLAYRSPARSRDYNFNVTTNRNSNSNDNTDFNSNGNENDNSSNANASNSSSPSSTSASSISDEDKHRLYQAAAQTGDQELIRRVSVKIGLMDENYTPGSNYQQFLSEHIEWVMKNTDFIGTINSPEKARAYVDEHFPE